LRSGKTVASGTDAPHWELGDPPHGRSRIMTQRPDEQQDTTDLDELNPHGAGAGVGADNTFEPEEDEDAPVDTDDKS